MTVPHDLTTHQEPVSSLVPWARNPRINDAAAKRLARSIEAHGWTVPILAQRGSRRVIAGHTRLKAAAILGMESVPVIWLDVDDAQAERLAIADNRMGEFAEWDDGLLAEILAPMNGDALEAIGFSSDDLAELLDPLHESSALGDKSAKKREAVVGLMVSVSELRSIEAAIDAAIRRGAPTRGKALAEIAEAYLR